MMRKEPNSRPTHRMFPGGGEGGRPPGGQAVPAVDSARPQRWPCSMMANPRHWCNALVERQCAANPVHTLAMSHESLLRDEAIEPSSNRAFGLVFATVFALIGTFPLLSGDDVRLWSLAIAAAFLVVALTLPSVLTQLNRLWLRFGLLLHRIVSPVVLGIMFFLVVTPTGFVMRLLGKDPLRLRYDKAASTYWIERTPPGPPADSLDRQF